jgi:hypothetical protein
VDEGEKMGTVVGRLEFCLGDDQFSALGGVFTACMM